MSSPFRTPARTPSEASARDAKWMRSLQASRDPSPRARPPSIASLMNFATNFASLFVTQSEQVKRYLAPAGPVSKNRFTEASSNMAYENPSAVLKAYTTAGGFLRSLNDTELSTTESLHGEGRHRISRQESVRPGETDQAQKRHNQRGPRHRPHRTHRPHWSPTPFTPLIACEREVPPACPDPERSCRAPRETRKTEQSCTAGEKPRV